MTRSGDVGAQITQLRTDQLSRAQAQTRTKNGVKKKKTEQLGGVVHAYNPDTQEEDIKDCSEFEASLIYMPSGPARAI